MTEVNTMPEYLDLRVHDRVALDEIELYAEVLSAVAASDGPLTREQLDEVLGVRPQVKILGRIALPPVPRPVKPGTQQAGRRRLRRDREPR
jgi:hypothetical protein